MGFVIIALFIVGEIVRHILSAGSKSKPLLPKLQYPDFVSLIKWSGIAFLITFINPNGWRVYQELYQTIIDRDVLNRIMEWLPVTLTSIGSYNMMLMVVLLLILLFVNRGKFDTTKLILVAVVFIFSLSSWRHVPIFALVAMVLLTEQLDYLFKRSALQALGTFMGIMSMLVILVLASSWQMFRIAHAVSKPDLYGEIYHYPYGAIEHLKENPSDKDRMFNEYSWGGYLIWQYPERKIFIDGRMAIWKHEDFKIFDDSNTITGNDKKAALSVIDRWQIDLLLINRNRAINQFLSEMPDVWSVKYRDGIATIWEKI